jgi:membrane protein YdbS with pleckstrin-like domain
MPPCRPAVEALPDGWVPVSPKLATARRIVLLIVVAAEAVVLALVRGLLPSWLWWVLVGVIVIELVWGWWVIGRRVRSFGYLERSDDLLVRSGIMFQRVVVVPYGRMQLVEVAAGPLDRALGITTVQLHTASATSDAAIPGLEPDAAADLRDRLARLGEQRHAGL